jgi:3-hydroxybutyryl-CoA dehydrogenase
MEEIKGPIGVMGFGTMGTGIAIAVASAGYRVVAVEESEERLHAGMEKTALALAKAESRGRLGTTTAAEVLGRLDGKTSVNAFAGCDLVIEAIVEDLDAKLHALADLASSVEATTLLATNTSALSVSRLATAVSHPDRFAGLHFFNPAERMRLVEVIGALQSGEATITSLVSFAESIGKEAVIAKDRPGFLLNQLLMPYLNQVVQAYDDGIASASDIDTAIELGLGYPMGPLKLLDLIGLDTHLHATSAAYEEWRAPRFAPPPLLARMVDAGYVGLKSRRGFRSGEAEA